MSGFFGGSSKPTTQQDIGNYQYIPAHPYIHQSIDLRQAEELSYFMGNQLNPIQQPLQQPAWDERQIKAKDIEIEFLRDQVTVKDIELKELRAEAKKLKEPYARFELLDLEEK